jgi:hypothetical protein
MMANILIFSWFIGNDIIYKQLPTSYVNTVVGSKYFDILLDEYTFPFSVELQNGDGNPVNYTTYLNLTIVYYYRFIDDQGSSKFNATNSNLIPCKKENFPTIIDEEFDSAGLAYHILNVLKIKLLP